MDDFLKRYPILSATATEIRQATTMLVQGFRTGNKLLLCGNGGSCADCEHIVGELMKGFLLRRTLSSEQKQRMKLLCPQLDENYLDRLQQAVPAIALPSFTALNTATCNDVDPELVFAQALMGLGKKDDLLLCISTSGNSTNVVAAALVAKALGLKVIGLTGQMGGRLRDICEVCICVPAMETVQVQELHLPVYHYLCAQIEAQLFA